LDSCMYDWGCISRGRVMGTGNTHTWSWCTTVQFAYPSAGHGDHFKLADFLMTEK
jgi:hypothetical protein